MIVSTKIEFRHRQIQQLGDITDLVTILFPTNKNQQHAAARILLALKASHHLVPNLAFLQEEFNISRRTLERARAKLSRLGLIERVSWMNTRYGGQEGWKLSGRMSTALRQLADKVDDWRKDQCKARRMKDEVLVRMLN